MSHPCKQYVVNGIRMNVLDAGSGPAVLLVHGFPDTHAVWRQQIPALVAAGFRVIAPDTRGCGETDLSPDVADYAIDRLTDDLLALLDALHIDRAAVIAHDWGAMIAWRLAIFHPERVRQLAVLSVGHPRAYAAGGFMQKLRGYYILFLQWRGGAEFLARQADWWLFRAMTRFPGEFAQWREQLSRPGRLTAGANYYRANLGMLWDRRDYPKVRVPVLGIWSSNDLFLVESQMRQSGREVAAPWRYERVEGANHWLQLTAPEQVNRLLTDFLIRGE
ncbi:MAG TPA: alpha/beta hydrolase [Fluviicoccus sp.]|nr:alpha/beta hydrolase [Fluviicoccus sp.]